MAPFQSPYRQPPPASRATNWSTGCLIAIAVPAVMFAALLIFIIGVCGHW